MDGEAQGEGAGAEGLVMEDVQKTTDSLPIGSDSLPTGWDGVPQNPERDGWHWLVPAINPALPPGAYRWHAPPRADVVGQWDAGYPQDVVRRGYAYAAPCVMPDEAARMRSALRTIAGSGFISEALADMARKALGDG